MDTTTFHFTKKKPKKKLNSHYISKFWKHARSILTENVRRMVLKMEFNLKMAIRVRFLNLNCSLAVASRPRDLRRVLHWRGARAQTGRPLRKRSYDTCRRLWT